MVLLLGRDFRGAIITGILFVTFISWIPGHEVGLKRLLGKRLLGVGPPCFSQICVTTVLFPHRTLVKPLPSTLLCRQPT